MKIYHFYNLKLRINLDEILNKNFVKNKLVKQIYKIAKLVIETNSKMRKLKSYNKIINNLICKNRYYEVIDKEL